MRAGIGALYRGLPANIIGIMPEKTIKLAGDPPNIYIYIYIYIYIINIKIGWPVYSLHRAFIEP